MMGMAYGFVEMKGVTAAVDALDIMCKSAEVKLLTWERRWGGQLVTIIIGGEVAAVEEAVESACTYALRKPAMHGIIANPHEEIVRLVKESASRFHSGRRKMDEEKNR